MVRGRFVPALAGLLSLILASGCLNPDDGSPESTSESTDAGGTDASQAPQTSDGPSDVPTSPAPSQKPSGAPPGSDNQPPEATLEASALQGVAPLAIEFSVSGSDPDDDAISWTLDADGDGAEDASGSYEDLPATASFTYNEPGQYAALLTVTDGELSATAEVAINVTAPEAGGFQPIEFSGTTALPGSPATTPVSANGCVGFDAGQNELDCLFFELPPEAAGRSFNTTSTATALDLEFWTACDAVNGKAIEMFAADGMESGTVPAGSGCVVIWEYGPSTATMTIRIE